jgi:DNA polymerase I-like protein with 3'-5' exonuclease and polymerase domains
VYDEVVVEAPRDMAEQAREWLRKHMEVAMSNVLKGRVPLFVDVKVSESWV